MYFINYYYFCHAFYTCASGWGTRGNPTLRFDRNKLIECIVYCIAYNKVCENSLSILKKGNVEHMIIHRYELSDR